MGSVLIDIPIFLRRFNYDGVDGTLTAKRWWRFELPLMTAQLTRPSPDESTTNDDAPFPYGGGEPGLALPAANARGVLRPEDPTAAVGAAGSTACPDCAAETVNGAGLYVCPDCAWSGTLR